MANVTNLSVDEFNIVSTDACEPSVFEQRTNWSEFDFPNNESLLDPLAWDDYLKIVFYAVTLMVALVGNISVILTVVLNRSMRTTINLYLVNLAVADLLICICCMWVPLVNNITKPMFSLGQFFCKLNPFAQMTCLTSSVLTLSAISCDRFVAILFPLHVRITKQRTSVVISLVWAVSAAVAVPFLLVTKHKTFLWRGVVETVCDDEWPSTSTWDSTLNSCIITYPLKQAYYALVCVTLFFAPVSIMFSAYLLIICRLWRARAPGESNVANLNVQHRAKKKVIRMVCVVLLGFVVCWSPLQVSVLYAQFWHTASRHGELPQWYRQLEYFSMFLAYFNSALNPLLYGGFNNNFRQGLCNVLRCSYARPLRNPRQFSQKSSRTTVMSGLTGSPSTVRLNGTGPNTRMVELKTLQDSTHSRKG